jgi:hypothetical protein
MEGVSLRKFTLFLSVAAALATCAVVFGAGVAQAAVVSKTTFDLTGLTLSNPCTGEIVTFSSGTETITVRMTDAGSGRVNIGEQLNAHADGVGATTGAAYRLNENVSITENNVLVPANGAIVLQESVAANIIAQGNLSNFQEHADVHETITPDGTLTAFRDNLTTNCQ